MPAGSAAATAYRLGVVADESPAGGGELEPDRRQQQEPEEEVDGEVIVEREGRSGLDEEQDEGDEPGRLRQSLVALRAASGHANQPPHHGSIRSAAVISL